MADTDPERRPAPDERDDAAAHLPETLVSRPLAAFVLVLLLAAGAVSAWLVVRGDFESARVEAPAQAGIAPPH